MAPRPPNAAPRPPSAAIDEPAQCAPSGNAPRPTRTRRYGPSATTTPPRTIAALAGPSSSASESHPCSGTTGAAAAAAMNSRIQAASTSGTPRIGGLAENDGRSDSRDALAGGTGVAAAGHGGPRPDEEDGVERHEPPDDARREERQRGVEGGGPACLARDQERDEAH